MTENPQYWLVGAYWDDSVDMTDIFVSGGYWEMGWDDEDRPEYAELRNQMEAGDRIANKARGGRGQSDIIVKAIGVIEAVDPFNGRVHVDWKLSGLDRRVESKGKFKTVHPPLSPESDDEWINAIFTL